MCHVVSICIFAGDQPNVGVAHVHLQRGRAGGEVGANEVARSFFMILFQEVQAAEMICAGMFHFKVLCRWD